jgi:hypothetical protein
MKVVSSLAFSLLLTSGGLCNIAHALKEKPLIPYSAGAWLDDASYPNGLKGTPLYKAGTYTDMLEDFNQYAMNERKIHRVYSHGGMIQMYCRGAGSSWPYVRCTKDNVDVFYDVPYYGDSGRASTKIYNDVKISEHRARIHICDDNDDDDNISEKDCELYISKNRATGGAACVPQTCVPQVQNNESNESIDVVPVIEGQLDGLYLNALEVNPYAAEVVADKVAEVYCNDPNVAGLQINLAPFDINRSGQFAFYKHLNKLLGQASNQCVDAKHPQGRYFSVLGIPGSYNVKGEFVSFDDNTWKKLKTVLGDRGYFIMQGYNLGPKGQGEYTNTKDYHAYLERELVAMMAAAKRYGIKYSVAIPVTASTKEFEMRALYQFGGKNTNVKKYSSSQRDYVSIALKLIAKHGLIEGSHYVGLDYMGWNKTMSYIPATNQVFYPSSVTESMESLLRGVNLQ